MRRQVDFLVIGAGVAGLSYALRVADLVDELAHGQQIHGFTWRDVKESLYRSFFHELLNNLHKISDKQIVENNILIDHNR